MSSQIHDVCTKLCYWFCVFLQTLTEFSEARRLVLSVFNDSTKASQGSVVCFLWCLLSQIKRWLSEALRIGFACFSIASQFVHNTLEAILCVRRMFYEGVTALRTRLFLLSWNKVIKYKSSEE